MSNPVIFSTTVRIAVGRGHGVGVKVTQGDTAGPFRGASLGRVVTVVSHSISRGAFCNKDDQREVPKRVCRTNIPPRPRPRQPWPGRNGRGDGDGREGVSFSLRSTDCSFRRDHSEWRCNWPYPVIDASSTFVTLRWQDARRLV